MSKSRLLEIMNIFTGSDPPSFPVYFKFVGTTSLRFMLPEFIVSSFILSDFNTAEFIISRFTSTKIYITQVYVFRVYPDRIYFLLSPLFAKTASSSLSYQGLFVEVYLPQSLFCQGLICEGSPFIL